MDNGDGTHDVICTNPKCDGYVVKENVTHSYDETDHKCDCEKVEQFTVTFYERRAYYPKTPLGSITADYNADISAQVTAMGEKYSQQNPGETLIGWYEIEDSSYTSVDLTKMPGQNMSVAATSRYNTYYITWKVDGEQYGEKTKVTYNNSFRVPANPTKEGYTFQYWADENGNKLKTWTSSTGAIVSDGNYKIAGDSTYTAVFAINTYTVTWVAEDGTTVVDTETVEYGKAATKTPAVPAKTGYTGEWEKTATNVTGNVTIKPVYTEIKYNIHFWADKNDEEPIATNNPHTYGENLSETGWDNMFNAIADQIPAREGWSVGGWVDADGNDIKQTTSMPAADLNVYAVWEANEYTLTIYAEQFSGDERLSNNPVEISVPYGAKLADYIPDNCGADWDFAPIHKPGTSVAVDGKHYKGTFSITGWENYVESTALDITTATMPVGDIEIRQAFTYTGWIYDYELDSETGLPTDNLLGTAYAVNDDCYTDTVAHIDGDAYFFNEDGYIVAGAGLVRHVTEDDTVEYYYFCDGYCEESDEACSFRDPSYTAFKDGTHWVYNDNDLLPNWDYEFDECGVIKHNENTSLNGLVDEGADTIYYIDGVPAYMGLIEIDGDLYYVRSNGKIVKNATYWISKTNGLMAEKAYAFDVGGKLIPEKTNLKNGIVAENGGLYYYEGGKLAYAGLIEIDGAVYYVRSNGQLVQNQKYWISKTNGLKPEAAYHFDADGKLYVPDPVVEIRDGYYYVDGVKTYAGLVEVDGDYYYVNSSCKVVKNCTYWISKTNDLLPEAAYTFDADGKIIFSEETGFTGIKDGYYYKNGVKTYAGLVEIDGDIYYVNSSCKVITGRTYWVSKTNGIMAEGAYTFDATGKLVG